MLAAAGGLHRWENYEELREGGERATPAFAGFFCALAHGVMAAGWLALQSVGGLTFLCRALSFFWGTAAQGNRLAVIDIAKSETRLVSRGAANGFVGIYNHSIVVGTLTLGGWVSASRLCGGGCSG